MHFDQHKPSYSPAPQEEKVVELIACEGGNQFSFQCGSFDDLAEQLEKRSSTKDIYKSTINNTASTASTTSAGFTISPSQEYEL